MQQDISELKQASSLLNESNTCGSKKIKVEFINSCKQNIKGKNVLPKEDITEVIYIEKKVKKSRHYLQELFENFKLYLKGKSCEESVNSGK